LPIPEDLLVSSSTASYYLKTHLDIQGAIDAIDRDEITVTPSFDLMQALLALQQLGFVEETTSRLFNGETQEFIFTPTTWLADKVQRVSFIVALDPDKVRLLFDLEIHSMFGRKTKQEEVSIPLTIIEDIGAVKGYLQQRLQAAVDGKSKNNNEARRSVFEGTMGMFVNNLLRDFQRKK
jgi:sporulation-control protein